jgi:hypothetical protein
MTRISLCCASAATAATSSFSTRSLITPRIHELDVHLARDVFSHDDIAGQQQSNGSFCLQGTLRQRRVTCAEDRPTARHVEPPSREHETVDSEILPYRASITVSCTQ